MSFGVSIAILTLTQAALIAVPGAPIRDLPSLLRGRWWAIAPPASIALVIAGIALIPGLADGFTYLALVAVPPLAALALAIWARGARPWLALAVLPLFVLAWATRTTIVGEASALALCCLACVSLGVLLVAVAPRRLVRLGVYAMSALDAALVGADLLQQPNTVLNHAAPAAGLPQLQSVVFGSAVMGFGDLFIAAVVGALLAADGRPRREAVALAAALGLAFDLLFLVVGELPATVPIAVTLAIVESRRRRATAPAGDARDRAVLASG